MSNDNQCQNCGVVYYSNSCPHCGSENGSTDNKLQYNMETSADTVIANPTMDMATVVPNPTITIEYVDVTQAVYKVLSWLAMLLSLGLVGTFVLPFLEFRSVYGGVSTVSGLKSVDIDFGASNSLIPTLCFMVLVMSVFLTMIFGVHIVRNYRMFEYRALVGCCIVMSLLCVVLSAVAMGLINIALNGGVGIGVAINVCLSTVLSCVVVAMWYLSSKQKRVA
ncbi:MAG: hypothetical protein FWF56_03150 [Firmicutes bacterium]|nr:hypothetical protein [Bacillota bacterium]MCL1953316.1 hypothetical protein [Bacillota bacterium]